MYPNKLKRKQKILLHAFLLGSFYRKTLNDMEFKALEMLIRHAPTTAEVNTFNRIEFNNTLIYGLDYKRMFRRNCSAVKYCSQQSYAFRQVKCFCQVSLGAEVKNVAFVDPLECCARYDPSSTHITAVTHDEGILHAIDVKDICINCLYVEIVGADGAVQQSYVSEFPNKIEVD